MNNPWSIDYRLLDKHSEDYDPDALAEAGDLMRKREKESGGVSPHLVSPVLRLTLDYCACAYCKTAKAALEDAWDAHRGRGR